MGAGIMGKKINRTKLDGAMKQVPGSVPLAIAFQSACGQAGGKVDLNNDGISCVLPDGQKIKGPGIEGPG